MAANTHETILPRDLPVAREKKKPLTEKQKLRRALTLLLAVMAFYLASLTYHSLKDATALVLPEPIGITYFVDEPSEYLIAHEHYHLKVQLEEEHWIKFYAKYLLGNGCIYEAEAGENPDKHSVCRIPWMKQPTEEQKISKEQVIDWYGKYLREQYSMAYQPAPRH